MFQPAMKKAVYAAMSITEKGHSSLKSKRISRPPPTHRDLSSDCKFFVGVIMLSLEHYFMSNIRLATNSV